MKVPIELLELIISHLWSSNISTLERLNVIQTFFLVSKLWVNIFLRYYLTEFHLLPYSAHYKWCKRFFSSPGYYHYGGVPPDSVEFAQDNCVSIHITYEDPMGPGIEEVKEQLNYASDLISNHLKKVEKLSINILNIGFQDPSRYGWLQCFPSQITTLELTYSFDKSKTITECRDVPCREAYVWYRIGFKRQPVRMPYALKIQNLILRGTSDEFIVAQLASFFSNITHSSLKYVESDGVPNLLPMAYTKPCLTEQGLLVKMILGQQRDAYSALRAMENTVARIVLAVKENGLVGFARLLDCDIPIDGINGID